MYTDDNQLYIAHCDNGPIYMVGKMACFQIQNLMVAYKERFDKDNFIKNLLLDNLLLVDIYSRAKKLHIRSDVPRVVRLVETGNIKDNNVKSPTLKDDEKFILNLPISITIFIVTKTTKFC